MGDTTQPHGILGSGRLAALLCLPLAAMIGCQANQPNAECVLAELRNGMWQHELEQLMGSRGGVLVSVRGTSADGQDWDYRLGDKLLRVWLAYPPFDQDRLDEYRNERRVGHWEIVDPEAEQRLEKELEKMDMATWLQMLKEASRATELEMRDQYWPPPDPNAK